jgi:hypothetical protein
MVGRARWGTFAAASTGLMACGLSVLGSNEGLAGPGAAGDAASPGSLIEGGGPDGTNAEGGAPPNEGGAEGGPDAASCAVVFEDDLTTPSTAWDLLGTAAVVANGVALTPQTSSAVAGAIWKKAELSFSGALHVVVDISLETGGSDPVGDGMTVAWIQSPPSYVIGSAGLSMGLCAVGLKGTAVQLDTAGRRLVVLNGFTANCETDGAILSNVPATTATQIIVDIRGDRMIGTLETGETMTRVKTIPTTGYLGITAGTGSGNTRHVVRHVTISSCS